MCRYDDMRMKGGFVYCKAMNAVVLGLEDEFLPVDIGWMEPRR